MRPGALCVGWLTVAALAAGAEPRRARLDYRLGRGAEGCPDSESIRAAVSARLGYDPFQPDAPLALTVSVTRRDRQLVARIHLENAGRSTGDRELSAGLRECTELAAAIELAISIAIDPHVLSRPPPPPPEPARPPPSEPAQLAPEPPGPTSEPAGPPPSEPAQPAPEPAPSPPEPGPVAAPEPPQAAAAAPLPAPLATFHVGLGVTGSAGLLPAPSVGLVASVRAQRGAFSLGLEARADPYARFEAAGGSVETSLLAAGLAGCAQVWRVGGCALGSAGALRVAGHGYDGAKLTWAPNAALGARLFTELPEGGAVSVRVQLDLWVPLFRTALQVSGATVWAVPAVAGTLSALAVLHL